MMMCASTSQIIDGDMSNRSTTNVETYDTVPFGNMKEEWKDVIRKPLEAKPTIKGKKKAEMCYLMSGTDQDILDKKYVTTYEDFMTLTATRDHFIKEQRADPRISKIWKSLKENSEEADKQQGVHKYCKIHEGLVQTNKYSREQEQGKKKGEHTWKVMVPETLQTFVMRQFHGLPISGHLGVKRTLRNIRLQFVWPGMETQVRRWIRGCLPCNRRKPARDMHQGNQRSITRGKPMELVAIDLVGPFKVKGDSIYLMVMIDVFTKWPIVIPIKTKTKEAVLEALQDSLVCEHGPPKAIMTDRGGEFVNHVMTDFCAKTGIKHYATKGLNPAGNGVVERFNRYLGAALTMFSNKYKTDFLHYLQPIRLAYRTSVHESTGYSPFELVYGRKPSHPINVHLDIEIGKNETAQSYGQKTAKRLKLI